MKSSLIEFVKPEGLSYMSNIQARFRAVTHDFSLESFWYVTRCCLDLSNLKVRVTLGD